jgi:hypothetical protein
MNLLILSAHCVCIYVRVKLQYELQVLAHDLDSDVNGRVSYSIARGDRHKQFSIDEKTGYIAVAGNLDREMVCYLSYCTI